jgi:hypothetical protein
MGAMGLLRILTVVRLVGVVLVVAAIVAQVKVGIDAGVFDAARFFAYFTIQSNLIGVVALLLVLASRGGERSRGLELLRGAAAVYLSVTFIVVIVLLSNVDVGLQLPWVDFVLHKVFPVIVVADWLLDPPHQRLDIRDTVYWLIYPATWVVFTLVRGANDGWYPYPFLDPANGGYGSVAIAIVGVLVGFLVLSALFVALGNARSRPPRALQPA